MVFPSSGGPVSVSLRTNALAEALGGAVELVARTFAP